MGSETSAAAPVEKTMFMAKHTMPASQRLALKEEHSVAISMRGTVTLEASQQRTLTLPYRTGQTWMLRQFRRLHNFATLDFSFMSSTSVFPVRPAVLRDARAIAELHNATVQDAYRGLLGDVQVPLMALDKRQAYWREAIEYAEPQVHVALHGERIVGFVGFDRSRDEGTKPTMGEIWSIYADADFVGLGVGLSLWDAAREGLIEEGCTDVSIWLPLANERAMQFFSNAGFKREMPSAKTVSIGGVKIEEIRLKRPLS
jgi:ribosomal protein S18 acetylase RimI-like enzyme